MLYVGERTFDSRISHPPDNSTTGQLTPWTIHPRTITLRTIFPPILSRTYPLRTILPPRRANMHTSTSVAPGQLPPDNNNPGQVSLLFRIGQVPQTTPPANNLCESYSRFHYSETYSYSRFHCSETRVISITGYAEVTTLVIPASTEVKHTSFSSLYT